MLLLNGCIENEIRSESKNKNWLIDYSPIHSIGAENDDFWIEYPNLHPNNTQAVSHLPWVNDSLNKGCVIFVVHKTGCESCQPQADRVINLAEEYNEYLVFHDLDATLGGLIEQRAYDSYIYDPDGPPGYIALTSIFTLIENDGKIDYGWHSWEQDVDYSELEEWIRDGIYYWQKNIGGL